MIEGLRPLHATLEEMCADFERLSSDLKSAESGAKQMSNGLREDYLSSIHDLKKEILEWLAEARVGTSQAGMKNE
ncbi:hypothetical protein [Shimia sp.]|uniref:hypothetical protein n=1 Tax=Shimia sp. TaxID=1954381 RepID=UPI0032978041